MMSNEKYSAQYIKEQIFAFSDYFIQYNHVCRVIDVMRWLITQFENYELFYGHGTDNAHDEACSLIFDQLNLSETYANCYLNAVLTPVELDNILDLAYQRIALRIPLPYLLKKANFCGLQFFIDQRVLVPRSPFAELIQNNFQPWLDSTNLNNVLDLCTGSGCIGIAVAQYFEETTVDLVDISDEAIVVAQTNVDKYNLDDRITIYKSDLFLQLPNSKKNSYDLIISNPPYVDAYELRNMPAEFHAEPTLGLAAGHDGLDIVKNILARASDYLTKDGWLMVEVGYSRNALERLFPEVPFIWPEFENGGYGIFLLEAKYCYQFQSLFEQYLINA